VLKFQKDNGGVVMKKLLMILLVAGMISGLALVAETVAGEYTVQSVTGKVEREVSAGNWEAITRGMKLSPATVVNTGLNSNLVLKADGKAVTIKAMQKGTVEKLTSGLANAGTGIKLGSRAIKSDAAEDSGPGRTNISTASTRASDATGDIEWEE